MPELQINVSPTVVSSASDFNKNWGTGSYIMAEHNIVGAWGEKVAREYLLARGYAIMAENTRIGRYEIDIIAMKGNEIAFTEVKTRSTDFSDPLDAVDPAKQRRLAGAADAYIRAYNIVHEPRFDIITVIGTPDDYRLEHYPDAFRPPLKCI